MVTSPLNHIDFPKTVRLQGERPLATALRGLYEASGILPSQIRLKAGVLSEVNDRGVITANYYAATLATPVDIRTQNPDEPLTSWIPINVLQNLSNTAFLRRRRELLNKATI